MSEIDVYVMTNLLIEYFPENIALVLSEAMRRGLMVIIDGKQGPTGKTTLCTKLRELGINAFEKWEMPKNKMGNDNAANITITLNKII